MLYSAVMTAKLYPLALKGAGSREVLLKTPSSLKEAEALADFNRKWQRENVKDLASGFLSGGHFTPAIFMKMARQKDTVVGFFQGRLISYYTINSVVKEGVLLEQFEKAEDLKTKGIIPHQANVAVGVQVVVDTEYQGSVLAKLMLDRLVENTRDRFDYFYTSISRKNKKSIAAHKKAAWAFVEEDDCLHHLIYDLNTHINSVKYG